MNEKLKKWSKNLPLNNSLNYCAVEVDSENEDKKCTVFVVGNTEQHARENADNLKKILGIC